MKNLEISQRKKLLFIGGAISGLSVGLYPFIVINFIKNKDIDLSFFITYTFLMVILLIYVIIEIINLKKRG